MATAGFRFEPPSDASQAAIFPSERGAEPRSFAANADVLVGLDRDAGRDVDAPRPGGLDRATVEAALARVLASETFRQSKRHRDFLAHVVATTLDGHSACLKEVVIGLEVFSRRLDGYDPNRDTIVRVEARRLRAKLARYYLREGVDDDVEIVLPVGGYVPGFKTRAGTRACARAQPAFMVLPFSTVWDEPRLAGFGAGLADLLVDRLGRRGGLKIAATRDATGRVGEARAVDSGAIHVIDGTILRHGTRLRCIVHMSMQSSRCRLWSDVFDFDSAVEGSDLFAFQDRLVEAVFVAATAQREAADVVLS